MLEELSIIGQKFRLPGRVDSYEIINNGHINSTYKVNYILPDGNPKSYIFQKINTYVFKNPVEIMKNIDLITSHIRAKCPGRISLHFHHTHDGENYVFSEKSFWRVMNYVDSVTYNTYKDMDIIRAGGEAFGDFQLQLSDFDASLLFETIPDFHDTKKRLETLFKDAQEDALGRVSNVREELEYIASVKEFAWELSERYKAGEFPVRVTHNDTKVNNVLFDKVTHEPLVVIDLDTVMPGMAMYDFGDAARFICNTSLEDEPDLSRVWFDAKKYEAFAEGFISKVRDGWTDEELAGCTHSTFAITIELASRFLDDYITGDKYFKTSYEGHNLTRTRCLLHLAKSITEQYDTLCSIVNRVIEGK